MYLLTILLSLFAIAPSPADTVMLAGVDIVSSVKFSDDAAITEEELLTIVEEAESEGGIDSAGNALRMEFHAAFSPVIW